MYEAGFETERDSEQVRGRQSREKGKKKDFLCGSPLWAVRDSNSRQPGCKPGALPTELTARNYLMISDLLFCVKSSRFQIQKKYFF